MVRAAVALFLLVVLGSALEAAETQEAPYYFALAKMLASEGAYREAQDAFQAAVEQAPADPYIRIEYAEFLVRLAQVSGDPRRQLRQLLQAAEQADEARRLAPENLDALEMVGRVHLSLAHENSQALTVAQEAFEAVRKRAPRNVEVLFSLGQIYLRQEQPARAAEVFEELVRLTSANRMAYSMWVDSLLRANRLRQAEKALGEMLALEPDSLEARFKLAELQRQRGDYEGAVATLKAAPPEMLDEPEVSRRLVFELYRAGDLEGARELAERLLASQPGDRVGRTVKALVLTAQARNPEAIQVLSDLHHDHPDNQEMAVVLARVLEREGRREEAAQVLEGQLRRFEEAGEKEAAGTLRLELALLRANAEEWSRVGEILEPLLQGPDSSLKLRALSLNAEALFRLGRGDEAAALLERERETFRYLTVKQAEILFRLERPAEAQALLDSLRKPDDTEGLLWTVEVYQRLERYEDSIPLLEGIIQESSESPDALFLLGAAYERTGRRKEAEAAFRKLLDLDPDNHRTLNYLGYMWAEMGENLEEALRLVQRAVVLEPENGAYVDSLGWVYFQMGRYEEARVYLERAAGLLPDDATIVEHLGDVYRALGRLEEARAAYERALELGSENPEQVREKLRDLGERRSNGR